MTHDDYIFWLGLGWTYFCLFTGIAFGWYLWVYKKKQEPHP
jgi:hypothetical protein